MRVSDQLTFRIWPRRKLQCTYVH